MASSGVFLRARDQDRRRLRASSAGVAFGSHAQCANKGAFRRARGLKLAGWVANEVDPDMPERAANLATLRARLNAPLLAHWAWDPNATPAELARSLRLS